MTNHKLVAIMFTDIAGYTKLMESDESSTLSLLEKNHSIHEKLIRKYEGRIIKEIGDGFLTVFESSYNAVLCAAAIIHEIEKAGIPLRIGIHQGDVVIKDQDILGKGVNIANRIQEMAKTNQLLVSSGVYGSIVNKKGIYSEIIGVFTLKNVEERLKLYSIYVDRSLLKQSNPQSGRQKEKSYKSLLRIMGYLAVVFLLYFVFREGFIKNSLSHSYLTLGAIFLLLITPSIAFFLHNKDEKSTAKVRKFKNWLYPLNLILAVGMTYTFYANLYTDAYLQNIVITDEYGATKQRQIVNTNYVTTFPIYYYHQEGKNQDAAWLRAAIPVALEHDLRQNKFILIGDYGDHGLLQSQINYTRRLGCNYFISGSYKMVADSFAIKTNIYQMPSGNLLYAYDHSGTDFFKVIDAISKDFLNDFILNDMHYRDDSQDLPVAHLLTDNFEAFKYFVYADEELKDTNGNTISRSSIMIWPLSWILVLQ